MTSGHVQAPVSRLLDPNLTPAAKVIWLTISRDPSMTRPAVLAAATRLTLPTVRQGLTQLTSAGWYERAPAGPTVTIPGGLLSDPRVRPQAVLLYGLLQTLPTFTQNAGAFTYKALATHTRLSVDTVRLSVQQLLHSGWIDATQANQKAPVQFALLNPGLAEAAQAQRRLDEADYRGEAIMREYLLLLIDSDEFEDNARPGFLVNPLTDERMELDRYYAPSVAFEFHGPQHFRTTKLYPSERELWAQQARDLMKEAICARRGIRLVVITREDLTLETMRQKVGNLLPLRDLRGHEELIAFLESLSK